MKRHVRHEQRRGAILPLTVLTLVGMCGFVGLAIDLGMIAVVRTQCQAAADAAAMAGARSLNGSSGQNLGSTTTSGTAMYNCLQTTTANSILGGNFASSNLAMSFGSWSYNSSTQLFTPVFPDSSGNLPTGDNYTLCQTTVTYNVKVTFAAVLQALDPSFLSTTTVTAVAQAAHRPRDVCVILDYSGSMNNESDLWNNESYLDNGNTNTTLGYTWPQIDNCNYTSNNLETVYPQFGPYSNGNNYSDYTSWPNLLCPAASTAAANYFNTATGSPATVPATAVLIGRSNVSISVLGMPSMIDDYYSNAAGASTLTYAFSAQPTSYATTPGGDNYLRNNGGTSNTWTSPYGTTYSTTVATTVNDILGTTTKNATWEGNGYKGVVGTRYKDVNGNTVTAYQRLHRWPELLGQNLLHLAARSNK